MKINTNAKKIEEVLSRGVEAVYSSKEDLKKILLSGKKLRLYNGIDPTNPNIHLGNAISLWKLREFQELGHEVILLIGDFTARIGDPSDKITTRPRLSELQILENARTYKKQAEKILDFSSKNNPCQLKFNSHWLDKLTNKDLLELAGCFTVQQMIERDLFQRRLKEKRPIGLHEFLYPLYQGYDSFAMDVDAEIGGRDQTFNMLAGRDLVKILRQKEKFVITTPFLEGTDGRKMSKSWGNVINIADSPREQYGKIMSTKDELLLNYFRLATRLPELEIKEIERGLRSRKINPRQAKARLAREIVGLYYGQKQALSEEKEFDKVFKEKKPPSDIPAIEIKEKKLNILELLAKTGLASSKSEAKRLILQKGVKIDNEIQTDWRKVILVKKGLLLQVGPRKFVKVK